MPSSVAANNIPFPVLGQPRPVTQVMHRGQQHFFSYVPLPYLPDPACNPIGWCIGPKGAMIKFLRQLGGNNGLEVTVITDPTTYYRQWTPALHWAHGPTRVEVLQPVSGGETAKSNVLKVIRLIEALLVDKMIFWELAMTFSGFQDAFDKYLTAVVAEYGDNLNARYPGVPAWVDGH